MRDGRRSSRMVTEYPQSASVSRAGVMFSRINWCSAIHYQAGNSHLLNKLLYSISSKVCCLVGRLQNKRIPKICKHKKREQTIKSKLWNDTYARIRSIRCLATHTHCEMKYVHIQPSIGSPPYLPLPLCNNPASPLLFLFLSKIWHSKNKTNTIIKSTIYTTKHQKSSL